MKEVLLRDAVGAVMRRLEAKQQELPVANPQSLLQEILSAKELKHVKFNYFHKGTFGITVDSSVWIYQLNLRKEDLLAQLKKKDAKVNNIRFCLGDIK